MNHEENGEKLVVIPTWYGYRRGGLFIYRLPLLRNLEGFTR